MILRTTVFQGHTGVAKIEIVWKRADGQIVEHWYETHDVQVLLGFATKLNGVANTMLRHAPRPTPEPSHGPSTPTPSV